MAARGGEATLRLLWWLLNALEAVLLVVWTVGWISAALVVRMVTRSAEVPLAMARHIWAPGLLAVGRIRLDVRGREDLDLTRPHLFVMNHQSQVDICVAFCAVPVNLRFLVKSELKAMPFLGWYVAAMGMVFIDRRERLRSLGELDQVQRLLEGGRSVLSFPEGSRSRDGRVRGFKTGVFVPAIAAGVDIVPVAVEGAAEVLPVGTFRARPGVIRVTFGEPIPTVGYDPDDRAEVARRARQAVMELLGKDEAAEAVEG